jgi:short-subunit dehydrogenase
VVRELAARGADVALIARGRDALEVARAEVDPRVMAQRCANW